MNTGASERRTPWQHVLRFVAVADEHPTIGEALLGASGRGRLAVGICGRCFEVPVGELRRIERLDPIELVVYSRQVPA